MDSSAPEVEFARRVVTHAGAVARTIRDDLCGQSLEKEDRSPVTVADYAIQAVIACELARAFPSDPLVAEESSAELRKPEAAGLRRNVVDRVRNSFPEARPQDVFEWLDRGAGYTSERVWTLDPIDGTKGFLRGGHYAVALALIENGRVTLGALACPHWSPEEAWQPGGPGSIVLAVRGQGTWCFSGEGGAEARRLTVSSRKDPVQARLLRSFESGHTNVDQMTRLAENLGSRAEPVRMDSQAKYAVLAAGQGDMLFRLLRADKLDYRERIWDQAAGSIVVEEAGGRITDLAGRELDFGTGPRLTRNRGVFASNSLLHEAGLGSLVNVEAVRRLT